MLNEPADKDLALMTKILRHRLDTKREITRQTNLVTDLGADSLDVVEILMDVEDEFALAPQMLKIDIDMSDTGNLTVGNILDTLPYQR